VGEWVVEPDLGRCSRDSDQVSLPPHAMDLLVFLAQRSSEVISIEEMIQEVWHGKPMTTGSVYNSLNTLRQAFGDDPRNPEYIETIPKRGYRLIAPVAFEAPMTDTGPAGEVSKARFSMTSMLVVVALVGVVLLSSLWFKREGPLVSAVESIPEKSIAVLPFIDLSPEGDQEYFAHGVAEEILNDISGYPGLKVVGRTSSFTFKGSGQDLRDIGRQLGVAYLLEGSVRREGRQLRITSQLVKADDGFHVWSGEYDAEVGQVFQIQDEIAEIIASELELAVSGYREIDGRPGTAEKTLEISAYDLLLLARARIYDGGLDELETAVEYLQQALKIDPDYAAAHAELAYAWITLYNFHRSRYPASKWTTRDGLIMQHAERAVALDPGLADAQFASGAISHLVAATWGNFVDLEKAESAYKKALKINPNHARTHLWLSGLMRLQRKSWNERLVPARRAMELEPLWVFPKLFFVELVYYMSAPRQEKWAIIRQLKTSLENPDQLRQTHWKEQWALESEGRFAEAIQAGEAFISSGEDDLNFPLNSGLMGIYMSSLYMIGAYDEVLKWPGYRQANFEVHFPGGVEVGEPSYTKRCILAEIKRIPLRYAQCSYEELLRGNMQQAQKIMEENLPVGLLDFHSFKGWHHTLNNLRSPAITLATIHKLNGREDLALAYAEIEEEILESESENGAIESPVFSRTKARLHALRGENEKAIDELENLIAMGGTDFRVFMHPVYNDLHDHPRYKALQAQWMDLINAERAKLGYVPLELNSDAGPGMLPFKLE
jgi:TolB-like protein/DNA-binding winged helix-turn-helix (wHTH) protein